jgi:hypothetical protein
VDFQKRAFAFQKSLMSILSCYRYSRVFERVLKTHSREQAQHLIAMLTCAKRPLKWNEIQGSVSICVEDRSVDFEERQWVDDEKDICGSIVTCRPDGTLTLVHSTAYE